MEKATDIFWGHEEKVQGQKQGKPIPGSCVFVRSVQSDGVFAGTYANDFSNAERSQARINDERSMTLKQQSQFLPYEQARQARQGY